MSECHLEISLKTLENAWYMATNHSGARQQFKNFMFDKFAEEYSAGFNAARRISEGDYLEVPIDEVEDK